MKGKDVELQQLFILLEQQEREGERASNSICFMDVHGLVMHAVNSILDLHLAQNVDMLQTVKKISQEKDEAVHKLQSEYACSFIPKA